MVCWVKRCLRNPRNWLISRIPWRCTSLYLGDQTEDAIYKQSGYGSCAEEST